MTTLEQVRKAYEDLSEDDKKSFHQSIADRVHESIAAQERADGNKDGQSAEAREHEALGEEHAEGKGDVEELHEKDDTPEEKREDKRDEEKDDDFKERVLARLDALEKRLEEGEKSEKEDSHGVGLSQDERARTEGSKTHAPYLDRYKG